MKNEFEYLPSQETAKVNPCKEEKSIERNIGQHLLTKRRRNVDYTIPNPENVDRDKWVHKPGKTYSPGVDLSNSIYKDCIQP